MRISFDLDDTLICDEPFLPLEPNCVPFWLQPLFRESLRLGTRSLLQQLQKQNHSLWIYTTSYRRTCYLKCLFLFYGIRIDNVINGYKHERLVRNNPNLPWKNKYAPSKYPCNFGIDVHIDDSEGVRLEGLKHGFDVIIVHPQDPNWTQQVVRAIEEKTR
ncbi:MULTISPECIES: hypothetical protein [Nostocales]|uniref:FCP1 homology domain-containing protein n=2 Tax=Nostocales TaxID=1161 RepID=A0A0C1ND14_9CYAN|nr:hypothetical protein [Tolypothrix bouteillei]KAF3886620.1 hypothetical protein DA73_0400014895 [Tolypothrix bouteillei VB521301]